MASQSPRPELPADFAGVVRLFPLPNVVLFPHAVQPLHIFEPRYREMVEDSLAGDQLIAMALLQAGWEQDYEGRPPIHAVTCIGRIIAHARLDDGRFNLLLHGIKRAALLREFPAEHAFRLAEVAVLEDVYPAGGASQRSRMQRDLLLCLQRLVPNSAAVQEQVQELLGEQLSLGAIVDWMSFTLPIGLELKQQLLAETNVDLRSTCLLQRLQEMLAGEPPTDEQSFPPEFSSN